MTFKKLYNDMWFFNEFIEATNAILNHYPLSYPLAFCGRLKNKNHTYVYEVYKDSSCMERHTSYLHGYDTETKEIIMLPDYVQLESGTEIIPLTLMLYYEYNIV